MIEASTAKRAGRPYEVETDGAYISGSNFLMDVGVTAAYLYGELA